MLGATKSRKDNNPRPGESPPTGAEAEELWRRVHFHTGAAIRALQEALINRDSQLSDDTLSSVILILLVQVSSGEPVEVGLRFVLLADKLLPQSCISQ